MSARLMDVIASETCGKIYRTGKYGLDNSELNEYSSVWEKSAESSPRSKYVNLLPLSKKLASSGEQILTYFLDGSRRVFKAGEIAYEHSGGRRVIYPIIAGQVSTGCCRRTNKRLFPEISKYEIVAALPDIADPDGIPGFFPNVAAKLTLSPLMKRVKLEVSAVLTYSTAKDFRNTSYDDKGTAAIQSRMIEGEKSITEALIKKLNHKNYLVKDGSLEYRKKSQLPTQNYRWVIGLSKSFNPSACFYHGKENPGYIADLPEGHRTEAACFSKPEILGDAKFAVWYIRLHDRIYTRSAFDGVVKVEKMLVTQSEREQGIINSDEIDTLSAYILNERCPVCYGNDARWANHIYPIYLTEQYIKSKYISTEAFLHLF